MYVALIKSIIMELARISCIHVKFKISLLLCSDSNMLRASSMGTRHTSVANQVFEATRINCKVCENEGPRI